MGSRDDVLTDAEDADAGYIRVLVRLRPLDERRGVRTDGLLCVDREEALIKHKDHSYGPYTKVFDDAECNARLFDEVGQELVTSAQRGFNGTLFCYGQTGSGKTYTMGEIQNIGSEHEGLSHRIVRALFDAVMADAESMYEITLSYCQVYVEKIYDLLGEKQLDVLGRPVEVPLQLRADAKQGVLVQGAKHHPVKTAEEALKLTRMGQARLNFASTNMNKHSSRSHAVLQLHIKRATRESQQPGETANPSASSGHDPLASSAANAPLPPPGQSPRPGDLARWRHNSLKRSRLCRGHITRGQQHPVILQDLAD